MANWSQSHLLQSLGWAILNSLWQMALLWFLYSMANVLLRLSSARRYQLAVASMIAGCCWFVLTFLYFFESNPISSIAFFNQTIQESNHFFHILLLSASITYLSLLVFPAYRLYLNWQFIQKVKKQGLQKADLCCRLFVQRVAQQLGLKKKVQVYLSELVKSPAR